MGRVAIFLPRCAAVPPPKWFLPPFRRFGVGFGRPLYAGFSLVRVLVRDWRRFRPSLFVAVSVVLRFRSYRIVSPRLSVLRRMAQSELGQKARCPPRSVSAFTDNSAYTRCESRPLTLEGLDLVV